MALFLFKVSSDSDETLNGRLPHEDNSDFDDFWTELIVMIWTFILATLRFFRFFFSRLGTRAGGWEGAGKFKFNVNQNENENKNASGGTCEGGAKRPPVGCFTRCVFVFVFRFDLRWIWVFRSALRITFFNLADCGLIWALINDQGKLINDFFLGNLLDSPQAQVSCWRRAAFESISYAESWEWQ